MVAAFPFTFVAEPQNAVPAASGVGSQTAVTLVLVTYISDTKPAIHTARSYVKHLGAGCHGVCRVTFGNSGRIPVTR
jgi:hypothetical protein